MRDVDEEEENYKEKVQKKKKIVVLREICMKGTDSKEALDDLRLREGM